MSQDAFLREVQRVETINRRLWWLLRLVLKPQLTPRCDNCVIPATYSELGPDGLCSECRQLQNRAQGIRAAAQPPPRFDPGEFDEILRRAAGQGPGQHDALILISGGKDSAYLLDRIGREHPGLRPLTVLVDTGFMSPIALGNMARLCERFGQDHITIRLERDFISKGFRFALTHLERQRGYSIVDMLDGTFIYDTALNLAAKLNIPLVLAGLSPIQVEQLFAHDHYELPPERILLAFEDLAQTPMPEIYTEHEMERFWSRDKYPGQPAPRLLLPMMVWQPDETEILEHVERSGLLEPNRTRPLLTNNALIPVIAIAEINAFGYTSFEVEFARMVREGRSERIYWRNLFEMAEYSARSGRFLSDSTLETLSALGLSKADVGLQA